MVALNDSELETVAERFYTEQKYNEAIRCYTEVIKKSPQKASYYKDRADCYVKTQNFDAAVDDLKQAVSLAADRLPYKFALSNALFEAGRYNEAIETTSTYDENGSYLMPLGSQLFALGKFEESISCYTEAINKNPHKEHWYYQQRGVSYLRTQQLDLAILDFKESISLSPDLHNSRLLLIEALLDLEKFDEAAEEMKVADIQDEELYELADELFGKQKFNQALHCCNGMIEKDGNVSEYYTLRGNVHRKMGNFPSAISDIKKSLDIYNDDHKNWFDLLEMLFEAKEYDEYKKAIEELEKKQLNPENLNKLEQFREKLKTVEEKKDGD